MTSRELANKVLQDFGNAQVRAAPKSAIEQWRTILMSGEVTHIRPRQWCRIWTLHAYNRAKNMPYVTSIEDSPEAYQIARECGISIEEVLR